MTTSNCTNYDDIPDFPEPPEDMAAFERTVALDRVYPYTLPPAVTPVICSKAALIERVPQMAEELADLETAMGESGFEVAGCLLDDGILPDDLMMPGGRALLAILPAKYEKYLDALVTQKFDSMTMTTLDLEQRFAIEYSSARLDDGTLTTFGWNATDTVGVSTDTGERGPRFWRTRLVLCAGDTVALGGFWQTDDDMDCAGATGICAQSHLDASDEELEDARAATAAAGSPMPWLGTVFDEGNGRSFALIPVFRRTKINHEQHSKDDILDDESEPAVSAPVPCFDDIIDYTSAPVQQVNRYHTVATYQVDELPDGGSSILRLCASMRTGDHSQRWMAPKVACTWNYLTVLPQFDDGHRYPMLLVHLPVAMLSDLDHFANCSLDVGKVSSWGSQSTVVTLTGKRNILDLNADSLFPLLRLSNRSHILVGFVCADQVRIAKYDFYRDDFLKICGHLLENKALYEAQRIGEKINAPEVTGALNDGRERWEPFIEDIDYDWLFNQ
jgi:hypothetical protein